MGDMYPRVHIALLGGRWKEPPSVAGPVQGEGPVQGKVREDLLSGPTNTGWSLPLFTILIFLFIMDILLILVF